MRTLRQLWRPRHNPTRACSWVILNEKTLDDALHRIDEHNYVDLYHTYGRLKRQAQLLEAYSHRAPWKVPAREYQLEINVNYHLVKAMLQQLSSKERRIEDFPKPITEGYEQLRNAFDDLRLTVESFYKQAPYAN